MDNHLILGCLTLSALLVTTTCNRAEKPVNPVVAAAQPASQVDVQALRTDIRDLRRQVYQLSSKVTRYESLALDPKENVGTRFY
jgi:outer membrane murein-binding lipoprotein Lpp